MFQLTPLSLSFLDQLLWAAIGLLLTIGGTFIPAAIVLPPLTPESWQLPLNLDFIQSYPLQVTYQIGAVLLVGCMGGAQAATLSQIAYLILGLSGFQIFAQGGGLFYLREPTFGYLLGFIPAAWVCGYLAFLKPPRLETFALSSLAGLVVIHAVGVLYLAGLVALRIIPENLQLALWHYSVQPLLGQLVMVCLVAVVARLLRFVLVY